MKRLLLLFTLVLLFAFSSSAQALPFTFSGTDDGGTGSATMGISIAGTTLTATLNNTSPITLNSPYIGENAPGITGFGFDLLHPLPTTLTSWVLTAQNSALSGTVIIGGFGSSNNEWILNTTMAGVTLDFFPTTEQENIDGALFNPLADESSELPGGQNSIFYTTAILTMTFDVVPDLNTNSPFVRMQNVGLDGEGSLKLHHDGYIPPLSVPEPATMLLLGSGFIGIAVSGKKRFKKRNG